MPQTILTFLQVGAPGILIIALVTNTIQTKLVSDATMRDQDQLIRDRDRAIAAIQDFRQDFRQYVIRNGLNEIVSSTIAPNPYVPYDPDLYEIELIEPVLIADDIKWKKVQ